jgi:DNA-binding transcriptional ArsR family regulator
VASADIGPVFAALADPTRRQLVSSLAAGTTVTATRLAADLPMTRQAVAKHLAALDNAGLVAAERRGRETVYRLTPEPLVDAAGWMAEIGDQWDQRLGALAAHLADRR